MNYRHFVANITRFSVNMAHIYNITCARAKNISTFARMKILIALLKGLSHLPLRLLYVLSDVLFVLVYYVVRYRRGVVRRNIDASFPERTAEERRGIERDFYRFFCDYIVETIKLLTISEEEIKRRMIIEGMPRLEESLEKCPFAFIYLGHYCNWEWVSSIPLWGEHGRVPSAQLYRPLKNKAFDRLFLDLRQRFGSKSISKYEALRQILKMKAEGVRSIVGFVSDQSPQPNSIHEWAEFLHQDTPVFTGTERIAKKVGAAIYIADVQRVRRGYYHMHLHLVTEEPAKYPDYELTQLYMTKLEQMIRRQPHLWLWSHKRWKHTRESVARELAKHKA